MTLARLHAAAYVCTTRHPRHFAGLKPRNRPNSQRFITKSGRFCVAPVVPLLFSELCWVLLVCVSVTAVCGEEVDLRKENECGGAASGSQEECEYAATDGKHRTARSVFQPRCPGSACSTGTSAFARHSQRHSLPPRL